MHLIYKLFGISVCSLAFGYYGKVEPINIYNIKSEINGKVIEVNKTAVATNYKGIVIKIDKYQDEVNLKNLQTQLSNLRNILMAQKKILEKKKNIFNTYNRLSSKSQFEKDIKFLDYQNILILVNQTKNTISNLEAQIKILKDKIFKKNISFKNYIYDININKGDYINFGTPIATTMDITKQKIYIFVPIDKIETIKNKKIYINDKLSNFKIEYIQKISDTKFITSYKVKLVGNYPIISDIVKINFK